MLDFMLGYAGLCSRENDLYRVLPKKGQQGYELLWIAKQ